MIIIYIYIILVGAALSAEGIYFYSYNLKLKDDLGFKLTEQLGVFKNPASSFSVIGIVSIVCGVLLVIAGVILLIDHILRKKRSRDSK